jgi:hypothetical protein
MPMKLTRSAFLQMLLSSRNIMALGQILQDLFADPSAVENLGFGVGKPPFQIGYGSSIGALFSKI